VLKLEEVQASHTKVVFREREVETRREVWEWNGCVCARAAIGAPSMSMLMRIAVACEDVADLRFELGVKGSAAEAELVVVVVLRMLNSRSCKEADGFPMGLHYPPLPTPCVGTSVQHTERLSGLRSAYRAKCPTIRADQSANTVGVRMALAPATYPTHLC
jgi:hypothetical protein